MVLESRTSIAVTGKRSGRSRGAGSSEHAVLGVVLGTSPFETCSLLWRLRCSGQRNIVLNSLHQPNAQYCTFGWCNKLRTFVLKMHGTDNFNIPKYWFIRSLDTCVVRSHTFDLGSNPCR